MRKVAGRGVGRGEGGEGGGHVISAKFDTKCSELTYGCQIMKMIL